MILRSVSSFVAAFGLVGGCGSAPRGPTATPGSVGETGANGAVATATTAASTPPSADANATSTSEPTGSPSANGYQPKPVPTSMIDTGAASTTLDPKLMRKLIVRARCFADRKTKGTLRVTVTVGKELVAKSIEPKVEGMTEAQKQCVVDVFAKATFPELEGTVLVEEIAVGPN